MRIFRLVTFTTAILALVIEPLNLLAHAAPAVHVLTLAISLLHFALYLLSRFGHRTHAALYIVATVAVLDLIWFFNGGHEGSVSYYFAPMLLSGLALFEGWRRVAVIGGQMINAVGVLLVEHLRPEWVVTFASPTDRLIDLTIGIVTATITTTVVGWLIIQSHATEEDRLTELAGRLAASELRYREIFNSTSDALIIHAADGRVLDVNSPACRLFGLEHEQAMGLRFGWCVHENDTTSIREAADRAALALSGAPQVFEWPCRRGTGEAFWSEVALQRGSFDGQPCVIASMRDISARKQVQQELLANEERLRLAMLATRQGWFEINVQTGHGVSSPEYPRLLGYEPAEFATSVANWVAGIHPDDREAAQRELRACIEHGDTRSIEYRRRTRDGAWKWIRSVGRVVERDPSNRPLRMVGMHADITERKDLESRLLHSQRLEAVGTLASGVAHDLNNILTPMLMGTGLLATKLADPEDREIMEMIESSGRRGAAIVKQLLAFGRAVAPERRPLDPTHLLREVIHLVRSSFPKEIQIEERIGDHPRLIEADSTQLHQVLVNLAVNARDAMPGGGTLTFGLDRAPRPGIEGVGEPGEPGSFLVFRVADTGHGIPPEIHDRIFDPFFTTKEPGKGTGLGLATVHGIVAAHRGHIRFNTSPDGTEFRIYLPVSTADAENGPEPAASPPIAPPASVRIGQTTILAIDDEPAVLTTLRRCLERHGYRVLTAGGGAEALALLQAQPNAVQLVITDFMMPGMDAVALVPRIRDLAPRMRIVGMSGLDQRSHAAALGMAAVLAKPFDEAVVVAAIAGALGVGTPAG